MKQDRKTGRGGGLRPRERRRLVQLAVCLVTFCAVFFGRGFLPAADMDTLRRAIAADADVQAVFADLGRFFAKTKRPEEGAAETGRPEEGAAETGRAEEGAAETGRAEEGPAETGPFEENAVAPTSAPVPESTPEPEPTPEPVPEPTSYPYDGPAAPANATMGYDRLDIAETMLPVEGRRTDGYGWRTHPVTGEDNFHHGLDLAAPAGTPIQAFADGYVEFVGEGDSYGKYVQIRHSDHVATLYAHCSKLLLPKGTAVKKGDTVALVGDTGMATGPHLHFEVKVDGIWHDPVYYLALP